MSCLYEVRAKSGQVESVYTKKKDFRIVRFDLDSLLARFIQGYFIPLCKRSMRYIGPRGENLSSRQGFYIKFFNDLTLDLVS